MSDRGPTLQPTEPVYASLGDIAKRHRCSRDAAREFIRRHRVPIFRPSQRRILVSLTDLERAERANLNADPPRLTPVGFGVPVRARARR